MLLGGLAGLHCHQSVTSEARGRKLCSNEKEGPQDREEEGTDGGCVEGWMDRTWQKMTCCNKDCGFNPRGKDQQPGWEVGKEAMPGRLTLAGS